VIRLLIALLPCAFVVGSWLWADGVPYYTDANETFASYLHARNMVTWDPRLTSWITIESTDPGQPTPTNGYVHNPNGPRYAHYLLFLIGLTDLRLQILVLTVAGALATAGLVWRLWQAAAYCRSALWGVVPLALFLDPIGCLYWLTNTYRLWTFVLYFACLWAVAARRPIWCAVATFLLFQYEYGSALFIGTTMTAFALLWHGRRAAPLVVASFMGAVLSLALFGYQVWSVYGTAGFLAELSGTALRRGTGGAAPSLLMLLGHLWGGSTALVGIVGTNSYSWPVAMLAVYGVLSAPAALILSRCAARRAVAALALATMAGALACAMLLWDYFVQGFIGSSLPLVTFLISLGVGSAALDVHRLGRGRAPILLCWALMLAPLVQAGAYRFRPPADGEVFRLLTDEYRSQRMVTPDSLVIPVSALTGAATIPSGGSWVTAESRERIEKSRPSSGRYRYVCIYPDAIRFRELIDRCQEAGALMVAQGDRIERSGRGWVVLRLKR
jgi:hypothetical protein